MQKRFLFLALLLLLFGISNKTVAMTENALASLIDESGCFSPAALAGKAELAKADRIVLGRHFVSQFLVEKGAMSAKKVTDMQAVTSLLLNLSEEATKAYLAARCANIIAGKVESVAEQARKNIYDRTDDVDKRRFVILTSLARAREATEAREAANSAELNWQILVNTLSKRMASAIFDYRFKKATNAAIVIQATVRKHKVRSRIAAEHDMIRARRSASDSAVIDAR